MSSAVEFRFQRGSANRWAEINPTLGPAEPGVEVDTGLFKMGNGHTPWNDLEYYLTESHVRAMVDLAVSETGGLSSDPRVGDLSELSTTAKTTIVSAINEINDGVSLLLLYDNAKAG